MQYCDLSGKWVPNNVKVEDNFGFSIVQTQNRIVIGIPGADDKAENNGAILICEKSDKNG